MWISFFGAIGARSVTSSSANVRPVGSAPPAIEVAPHAGRDELVDDVALDEPGRLAALVLERDELHAATPHTSSAASAYTCAVRTSPSMLRFSPSTGSGSPLDVP